MDYITINYETKRHALAEKYRPGSGKTLCGITIRNGITGGTAYRQTIDCARCTRILIREK